jgi:hypothetical protein
MPGGVGGEEPQGSPYPDSSVSTRDVFRLRNDATLRAQGSVVDVTKA